MSTNTKAANRGAPRRLTDEQVLDIIHLHDNEKWRQCDLAVEFNISQPCISHIIHGKLYGDVTGRVWGGVKRRPSHVTGGGHHRA